MKRIAIITVVLVFSLAFNLWADGPNIKIIENKGKPVYGEWKFNAQLSWATDKAGDDVPVRVGRIRVDSKGNVYVLEVTQTTIFVFDPNGKFIRSIGKKGEGPGEMKMAFDFFLVDNNLIVPDMGKIHFFSLEGKYLHSVHTGSAMIFPRAFIDANRFIYVSEQDEPGKKSGKPDLLKIFALDTKKSTLILEFSPEARMSASSGGMVVMFKDSSTTPGIILDYVDGKMIFGKSDRYLIKQTNLEGKESLAFTLEDRERKKIPLAVKEKRFENVRVNNARIPKDMLAQLVKGIPDEAPFFNRIMIAPTGLIFVFVSDLVNETGREVDIFSPTGKYLYHGEIKLPTNYKYKTPLAFDTNTSHIYVFAEDEEGESKLLKCTISLPKSPK